ncbi:hypothetical protein AB684_11480 [Bacillus licheniformis]|jgi:hypothetical protein|uniref:hypothetical protein n=1 Tax=Bacillus TaxID=1386 RepID=UPI00036A7E2A|nr:hypothetical protein [Bacillus licheniformis]AMR10774.1 hypothetical protein AB684_11480 [Bacillus licheniformis]AVI45371.1 hypothetical protein BL14DL4_00103 [Bacillus licheniformis]KJH58705.1 hypothetical protein UF14_09860 [Bacillus licheniformis]KYC83516.1 hypothetical protein B4091_2094 [Bacillus licheniformis]MCM3374186.1 hypothetical protein [Bacillus licheniformis]
MKIINFKFNVSYFEIYAEFSSKSEFHQSDYDIQMDLLKMTKAILKAAGYSKYLTVDTYTKDIDRNTVFCSYQLQNS